MLVSGSLAPTSRFWHIYIYTYIRISPFPVPLPGLIISLAVGFPLSAIGSQQTSEDLTSALDADNAELRLEVKTPAVGSCWMGLGWVIFSCSGTPLKSNIDTQNDAMFERRYIFQSIIFGIYRFRGCTFCSGETWDYYWWFRNPAFTSWGWYGSWNPMIYEEFFAFQVVQDFFRQYWTPPTWRVIPGLVSAVRQPTVTPIYFSHGVKGHL